MCHFFLKAAIHCDYFLSVLSEMCTYSREGFRSANAIPKPENNHKNMSKHFRQT